MIIKGKITAVLLGASLAACVASYVTGRVHQKSFHVQERAVEELAAWRRADELNIQLAEKEAELMAAQENLEEIANANPSTSGNCLPADRVWRLEQR